MFIGGGGWSMSDEKILAKGEKGETLGLHVKYIFKHIHMRTIQKGD